MSADLLPHLVIALCALLDPWAALPPALTFKLHSTHTAILIWTSSTTSMFLTIVVCTSAQRFIARRLGRGTIFGDRTAKFMSRWGTPGLGLMSPLILGPPLTSAAAIALGAKPSQLLTYGCAGVTFWSVIIWVVLMSAR